MSISANYASPITVNGFVCKNCTDVDFAKKHIDPAHPKDGPYGVDAKDKVKPAGDPRSPTITFGGQLAETAAAVPSARPAPATGTRLDLSV